MVFLDEKKGQIKMGEKTILWTYRKQNCHFYENAYLGIFSCQMHSLSLNAGDEFIREKVCSLFEIEFWGKIFLFIYFYHFHAFL